MAVTVNANMTTGNGNGGQCERVASNTTLSSTGLTIAAGSNRLLIVPIVWSNAGTLPSGITITWNGVGLTQVPSAYGGTTGSYAGLWYLLNPDTGNQTLTANWTTTSGCYMGAICFDGAGSISGGATNNTNTITLSAGANDASVAVYNCDGGTPVGDQTLVWSDSAFGPSAAANRAGGGSTTYTFEIGSSSFRTTAGVIVTEAGGGGSTGPKGQLPKLRFVLP